MAEGKKRAAVKARKLQEQSMKGSRRRARAANNNPPQDLYGARKVTRTATPGISITVQIPSLRRSSQIPKKPQHLTPPRRRAFAKPILLLPIILLIAGFVLFTDQDNTAKSQNTANVSSETVREEPSYEPLVPSAEQASATKYDGKRNLVSYTTTFSGARITVSQQAIPANFKHDNQALRKAADNIAAKKRIDTAKGPLYIATNDEDEDQMAIFADSRVLLFIHMDRTLDEMSWRSFIELLQPKTWIEISKEPVNG